MKIYVSSPSDRDTLCVILARNGYTVRQGKHKRNSGDKSTSAYVEIVDPERIKGEDEP